MAADCICTDFHTKLRKRNLSTEYLWNVRLSILQDVNGDLLHANENLAVNYITS